MSRTPQTTALLLTLAVAACAGPPPALDVPARLVPGGHETLAMVVPAKGVQIYECRARKDGAAGYEWAFVAPDAELFDMRGQRIGRHYAGPYWEAADGSRLLGSTKERADAPRAGAIPWLLLAAQPAGADGSFSKVTSIQRVNTVGGAPPAAGCSEASLGQRARVGYSADYRFFSGR